MKVVSWSALLNGRLYPPVNISGTHFRWRARGSVVVKALRYKSESPGIDSGNAGVFFRGIWQFHVPWGRLSL
jgi:hypothetical protein